MEKFLSELKGAEEGDVTREMEDSARVAERKAVHEAITEGLLQPHGLPPNTKQDGIFRLLCENPNGFNNRITGNWKLNKAIDLKDELKADGLLYCEHRLNLKHRDNQNNFKQMFQREIACQAVAGHNIHMNESKIQEGGTGMVTFGDATGYISKIGKDPYGLGRWCWTLYSGNDGHRTRVVTANNACKNNKKDSRTSYQQQRRFFIMKKKDLTCPNKLFRLHLIKQLTKWRAAGDRIILFMDHNEHVYDGPLG